MTNPKEKCGIAAIALEKKENIAYSLYNCLLSIQHRGQDAAGISVYNEGIIMTNRGMGLVTEAFTKKDLKSDGLIGIGHNRYPTTDRCKIEEVQPIEHEDISLAHNGHITNYLELKKELEKSGYKFKSGSDSEALVYLIHKGLADGKSLNETVKTLMEKTIGAYSVVGLVGGKLIVFRDPHGIRPLVYGKRGKDLCFASESVALEINGFEYVGQVEGGELIIVENSKIERKKLIEKRIRNCMFEYVYFSRPDSKINDKLVNNMRKNLGEQLAEEHPIKADVVIPVPDSSRTSAISFAKKLGMNYDEGLIKNRYIGRTFIMFTQAKRKDAVRRKLNPIKDIISGKKVVLVDDSIVRGTTMKEIVKMVKNAGAKEIHLRITCPPIKAPCFYGVDMSTYEELIANNKTIEEIKTYFEVDSLGYLSLGGLKKALGKDLCTGCLNEDYFSKYVNNVARETKEGNKKHLGRSCCG